MAWEARTNYAEISVGTRLCIYEVPQIGGEPAPRLIGNQSLKIETSRGRWISAEIESASATAATLVMPDGVRYQITPVRSGEFDSGVTLGEMYSQDWVVRSQIIPIAESSR